MSVFESLTLNLSVWLVGTLTPGNVRSIIWWFPLGEGSGVKAAVVGGVLGISQWGSIHGSAGIELSLRSAEPHVCCLSLMEVTSISFSRTFFYHCCLHFDGQTYRSSVRLPILPSYS